MERFPRLTSPLQVGGKQLRNRVAVTAHNLNWDRDGQLTKEYVSYLARRAEGGVGLLICFGAASVHARAGALFGRVSLWDPANEPLLTELAAAAHRHGAVIMSQVNHVGRRGSSVTSEQPLLAPSQQPEPAHREVPHELTVPEIEEIVASFADAAARLHRCGWDGVEITSFGGQLIEQFWSPVVNQRDDEYGGDFAGRMRFGTEVVRAVRAAVPSDFLVGFRLTGDPLTDDIGLGRDDMRDIARYLDGLGMIDVFDVSGGTGATLETQAGTVPPDTYARGCYLPLARAVKDVVSVPVLCAGRILDVEQAEQALADGDCDIVAMTRAHMADPDIVAKLQAGELDRVRPCIAVNDGCIGRSYQKLAVKCAVNPALGHEELDRPEPTATPRHVVVVGGGPAGMEAARVAAVRGHRVTLVEASGRLGGQVATARRSRHRPHLGRHVDWLAAELDRLEVRVRTGAATDARELTALAPDTIVVATGAESTTPVRPALAGVRYLTDVELFDDEPAVTAGEPALVYDRDGGIRGGLAAIQLAERGARVRLATPLQAPCQDVDPTQLPFLRRTLTALGVESVPDTELVSRPGDEALRFRDIWSRAEVTFDASLVVYAGIASSRTTLLRELDEVAPDLEVRAVGDCVAPRTLRDAVREGALAGAAV